MYFCSNHGYYNGLKCSKCEEIELLRRQNINLEDIKNIHIKSHEEKKYFIEEQIYQKERHHKAEMKIELLKLQIELERIEKTNINNQLIIDQSQDLNKVFDEAYQWKFALDSNIENTGKILPDGSIHYIYSKEYLLPNLVNTFKNGVDKRLEDELGKNFKLDSNFFKDSAYNIGLSGENSLVFKFIPDFLHNTFYIFKSDEIFPLNFEINNEKNSQKTKVHRLIYNLITNENNGKIEVIINKNILLPALINFGFDNELATEINIAYFDGLNKFLKNYLKKENKKKATDERLESILKIKHENEIKNSIELKTKKDNFFHKILFCSLFILIGTILLYISAIGIIEAERIKTISDFLYEFILSFLKHPLYFLGLLSGFSLIYASFVYYFDAGT